MSLLERFTQGDAEAFEDLFRKFQGGVFAWIVRIGRDRGVAEDLTLETFWRIYLARARFRPDGNFGAWAFRIATNVALKHLRQRRLEEALPGDIAHEDLPDAAVHQEAGDQIPPAVWKLPAKLPGALMLAPVE